MELDNCPRCGKLFAKNFREVCPACIKVIDQEYQTCADYLRKNRGTTINELSDETGITIKQITKFIREGRISLIDAPNLSYPCEACGTLIRDGNMCLDCKTRLLADVKKSNAQQTAKEEPEKPPSSAAAAYRIMDRLRDRK